MQIRLGMECARPALLRRARDLGALILVSANFLWDSRVQQFRGWKPYLAHDCALDSGGFVAMRLYGGYRWTVAQFAALAKAMQPAWWAQMDFCCEPELAADSSAVYRRIDLTVEYLHACRAA